MTLLCCAYIAWQSCTGPRVYAQYSGVAAAAGPGCWQPAANLQQCKYKCFPLRNKRTSTWWYICKLAMQEEIMRICIGSASTAACCWQLVSSPQTPHMQESTPNHDEKLKITGASSRCDAVLWPEMAHTLGQVVGWLAAVQITQLQSCMGRCTPTCTI